MLLANICILPLVAGTVLALRHITDPVEWVQTADRELGALYSEASLYTWHYTLGEKVFVRSSLNISLAEWKLRRCRETKDFPVVGKLMTRTVELICRGPMFTRQLEDRHNELLVSLRQMNAALELCGSPTQCYHVEPELERLMRLSRDPAFLRWAWEGWRNITAGPGLALYPPFIQILNMAARLNGYRDIGECWREELEVPELETEVERLLAEVGPFYSLLHGFVRHRLRQYYGPEVVSRTGPIPAHLLGNMWSQSWESIEDILLNSTLDLDAKIKKKYKNVPDMMKEAERYYVSLGLKPMTEKFWRNSVITKPVNGNVACHGTAANLFMKDDYRMLICASINWDDFYVIHHEMGHVQYYMAYADLPTVFKEAANSAYQESIGDTIMLAVETPDHLMRLGIINKTEDIEIPLLLYQALKKIPHIGFAYVVDKWRWGVMASNISVEDYNKAWWDLRTSVEGIEPPGPRGPWSFDAIAKFHISDNTPYIRYFLSEFIQFQLLDVLCELKREKYQIKNQPLHLCDLHGFEEAGKKLSVLMSHGSMKKWDEILDEFSGGKYNRMSAEPILKYFQPLITWLQDRMRAESIPLGW